MSSSVASTDTSSMEDDQDSYVSNTNAIVHGTGTCYSSECGGESMISDPNISMSSSTTNDLIIPPNDHQREIRIFNVDFRALSDCNNNREEEGSCAYGSESLHHSSPGGGVDSTNIRRLQRMRPPPISVPGPLPALSRPSGGHLEQYLPVPPIINPYSNYSFEIWEDMFLPCSKTG